MANQLLARYDPNPIPWGKPPHPQHRPMEVHVLLTVRAVDYSTLAPVDATVTSYNPYPDRVDDPNNLDFHTNIAQTLVLSQVTSHEGPHGSTLYLSPGVQVNAPGYDVVFLSLD